MNDPIPADSGVSSELLAILRCPQTGSRLRQASGEELRTLNDRIAAGGVLDASGETVTQPLDGALVTTCGTWTYPIRDQIPTLIPEEAIP